MSWYIAHSAKGSSWKKHRYIKKVGNRYYYSNDIKAGQNKMKNADQFNADMRDAKSDADRELALKRYNTNNWYQDNNNPDKTLLRDAQLVFFKYSGKHVRSH